jgi:serine/threonine-protein kinase HipA
MAMLDVWASNTLSGLLNRQGQWECSFTYQPGADAEDAVSIMMPPRPESWLHHGLHPIFEQNLPEGALRLWFDTVVAKTLPRYDDLELLRITGRSQIGRLRYSPQGSPLPEQTDDVPAVNLDDILRARGTEDLFEELMRMYALHSGLSGAQPKVMVRAEEAPIAAAGPERLTLKMPTHIVKTWQAGEFPELALNEALCMLAAKRAGLPVAETFISDDRRFLVVTRFDRNHDGSFKGFEDCCVLLNKSAKQKYTGSYEQVAKALRTYTMPTARQQTLSQIFTMVALSVAIRNGDAHHKNFGIIYDSPATRQGVIAPAFDLVTTTPYLPQDAMALTLAGTKRWPGRKALEEFGRISCDLNASEVRGCLEDVERGVSETMEDLAAWIEDEPAFRHVGRAMRAAWDAGLQEMAQPMRLGSSPSPS